MDTKDLRRHISEDSDAELGRYLDDLNWLERNAETIKERIMARENAMVVAHVIVNRKAARIA